MDQCMKVVLKILLLTADEREDYFFSVTTTQEDITLVLDQEYRNMFPEGVLSEESVWRALQINIGADGYTGTGIVRKCTAPLAKAKISIFHISTFNTDFIMVHDADLEAAKNAVTEHLTKGEDTSQEECPECLAPPNNKLVHRPYRLLLADLKKDFLQECTFTLLQTLFYPDSTQTLFHITATEEEMSLVLDAHLLDRFPQDSLVPTEVWCPLQRVGKRGLNETGVVSFLSKPIAEQHVSILYLSTNPSAFIMVPEKKLSESITALTKANVEVTQ